VIRTLALALLLGPALLLAQGGAPTPPGSSASGEWSISGVLVSATTGAPLDRAEVTLSTSGSDSRQIAAASTGETGSFRFRGLPAGKYLLQAARRGYISAGYMEHEGFFTAIVTGPGLTSQNLRFELKPKAVISGVVTDESGEPVQNAQVRLWRVAHFTGENQYVRDQTEMTDDTGVYEFNNLSPGTFYVEVTATPWYAAFSRRTLDGGRNFPPDDEQPRSPLDVAYPLTFYANATDSDSATPLIVRPGDRIEANVSLHAVPALHLRIRLGPSPQGPESHFLSAPQLNQENFGITEYAELGQSFIVPSGGELVDVISGIPPGHYTLRASGEHGLEGAGIGLSLSSSQTLEMSGIGTSSAALSGKLAMASGAKLPEHTVLSLRDLGSPQPGGAIPVDADGNFRLEGLAPGSYRVQVFSPGEVLSILQSAASGAEAHGATLLMGSDPALFAATLVSGSANISGFAQRDGKGFGGAMILLVPQNAADNPDLYRRDQSDSDGSFRLSRVVPGDYTLVAIENGWTLDWARPEAIAPYLAGGLKLRVVQGQKTVELTQAVPVQGP
jgi:hypothetical protein